MIKGMRDVEAGFAAAIAKIDGATKQGIKDVTFDLLGKAIRLAPIETGDLRGSGKADFSADGMEGAVSFGTVYARRQHEELTWKHLRGGQAKYLQQPFEENAGKYEKHIGDTAKGAIK